MWAFVYEIGTTKSNSGEVKRASYVSLVNPHILKNFSPRGQVCLSSKLLAATLDLSLNMKDLECLWTKAADAQRGLVLHGTLAASELARASPRGSAGRTEFQDRRSSLVDTLDRSVLASTNSSP